MPLSSNKKDIQLGIIGGIAFSVVWLIMSKFESLIPALLGGTAFTVIWIIIGMLRSE